MTEAVDGLVVDATVAIKWVVGEPDSDRAAALRGRRLVAPDLLVSECANVLWKKVARRELSAEEADMAARLLTAAEVELVATRPLFTAALEVAVALRHSAYNCMYLAVAEKLDLPLVTADGKLVQLVRSDRAGGLRHRVIALSEVAVPGSPS